MDNPGTSVEETKELKQEEKIKVGAAEKKYNKTWEENNGKVGIHQRKAVRGDHGLEIPKRSARWQITIGMQVGYEKLEMALVGRTRQLPETRNQRQAQKRQ